MVGEKDGVPLFAGEKTEPLGGGFNIIQSVSGYRFGSDAVELAHFAARHVKRTDSVLDLCSGCGIIGIMLAIDVGCSVTGVEIDKTLFSMSVRSAELNGLDGVKFINADARRRDFCAGRTFDAVVCNPPYYKQASSPASVAPSANSEINITLGEVVSAAERAVKQSGALFLTHVTTRLDEVICACRDVGLTVKQLVINPNGKTFMLRAVRGAKPHVTLEIKEYR